MRVLCCWNGWGIVQKCAGKLPVERICPVFGAEPGIRNRRGKATKKAFAISRKGLLSFGSPRRTWTANLVINSHLKSLFRVTSAHKNLFNFSIINTNLISQKLTFAHRFSHALAQNWRKNQGHFLITWCDNRHADAAHPLGIWLRMSTPNTAMKSSHTGLCPQACPRHFQARNSF